MVIFAAEKFCENVGKTLISCGGNFHDATNKGFIFAQEKFFMKKEITWKKCLQYIIQSNVIISPYAGGRYFSNTEP